MEMLERPGWWPDEQVHPPPFERNPSAWSQRVPIAVLAMVGAVISTYLALYQWGLIDSAWDPFFGNQTMKVLDSDTSRTMHRWFGIPDAALGAVAYLGDAVFGMAGSQRRWQYRPWLVLVFGFDVIPLGIVSIILVILQGVVVGSWCTLCLVTAAISVVLIVLAYDEVWASIRYLKRVWDLSHDRRVLWDAFVGRPTEIGARAALPDR